MNPLRTTSPSGWLLLLLCIASVSAPAQRPRRAAVINGEEILKTVEAPWKSVQDYTVTLDVVADIERMDIPPMHVTMYFKQPNKTHFESEGFAVLPREALQFHSRGLTERFAVEDAALDTVDGRVRYRLRLISRGESGTARRLVVFVDPDNNTIEGLESTTPDGRKMQATFSYTRVEERMLPASLEVEFVGDTLQPPPQSDPLSSRQGVRRGKVSIRFSEYRINSGLPDSLFLKKEP